MSKRIRVIYLYLVCLISLFLIVGAIISSVNYFAQYFFPTNSYSYYSVVERKLEMENDKIENLRNGISSLALLAVSTPLFIYHWKKVESERKELEV
jgi:hypothetical protein